jgi:hypothetical protein
MGDWRPIESLVEPIRFALTSFGLMLCEVLILLSDMVRTRNSRARGAHSGLHAKPGKHPTVDGDPGHEEADEQQDISHIDLS